jgi:hypothetical protein
LPAQFDGVSAYVYPIYTDEQYVVNVQSTTVAGPTIQPVRPLSVNLISDDPILFVLIIAAIGLCIAAVIKPAKIGRGKTVPQQTVSPEPSGPKAEAADLGRGKFCIYCGSSNKSFALYCENCGKKIA